MFGSLVAMLSLLTPPLVDVDVPVIREGLPFRGAAVPFGMMMFGPNTGEGYSLFTLQGAEVNGDFIGHVPFRPFISAPFEDVPNRNPKGAPGYFHDTLPEGIEVELTATARTGFARITFPAGASQNIRFGATSCTLDGQRLSGFHQKGLGYKVFFVVQFGRPVSLSSERVLSFPGSQRDVLMKVGMSYVSIENAEANLKKENSGWSFDKVREQASKAWEKVLSRVSVSGGTEASRNMLATCLYRCYLQPNLFSDFNGEYMGFDGAVHKVSNGARYANYSVWDIYRTWVQLLAVLEPAKVSDMMQTLVDAAATGGGAMPRWATANVETGIMEEASATPLVAGAYAFGARGFDLEAAWKAMNRAESEPGVKCQTTEAHPSLDLFLKDGYMPQGTDYNRQRAASFTLEYGMSAFTLAEFSASLGKKDATKHYLKQSQAWKILFNPLSGYIQSREVNGDWYPKQFDPAKGHFIGFTEGNSAQYTWTIRHNMRALVSLVGGRSVAVGRLDELFKDLNAGPNAAHCWIGNEPSLTLPWAYHWCGAPWKTQDVIDRIMDEVWKPGCIPGADDLGALSSWYVWASLGLFPAIPGTDVLLLTAPRFEKVVISLGGSRKLVIEAPRPGKYVKSVTFNGKPVTASWIRFSLLKNGGTLKYVLSDKAGEDWATRPDDEPPSFDAEAP